MSEINKLTLTQVFAFYYALKREDFLSRAEAMENYRVGANAKAQDYSEIVNALRSVDE